MKGTCDVLQKSRVYCTYLVLTILSVLLIVGVHHYLLHRVAFRVEDRLDYILPTEVRKW